MYDRPVRRLLVLIVCIVLFNIALTVYWLVVDSDSLKQSNLREQESQRTHSDYNDQIQPYLESPILPLTPNPVIDERDGTNKPHLPWYFKDGTMRPIIGTSYRTSARSPGVWPEETAAGDRVEEQLMFVPWRYDHDGALTKNILVYNDFDGWTVEAGQNEFLSKGCPVNRCAITTDKSEGPTADAILFRNEFSTPNHRKPGNQVWIMAVVRSAYYTELDRVDENAINWTATYRHDSDVVLPFGRWAYYDPSAAQVEQGRRNYALNKTRQAAMYVSRCGDTDNGRLAYAKTLGEYMTVDVYGACAGAETVDPDDFLAMLERDYKFYLAFEDSDCADYVTGQFFDNGLRRGALPIAMGGRREDYERIAPKWSYVYAGDFGSPEELAEYLHRLDADDGLYNEYFRWRGTGEFIDTRFFCRLCAMLHDGGAPVKHYRDFGAWWSGPGVCERPVAPLQPPPRTLQEQRGAASEREKTAGADEYEDVSYGDDETADASSRTGERAAV